MWTPKISSGAKRSLRTKSNLIPLKELKNGKRNNSQSQSLTPHPNPIESIKCSFFMIISSRFNELVDIQSGLIYRPTVCNELSF